MRFFSMKRTASQHSFDTTSMDGSGPEDGLSVDSDGSDGFVMLTDSGKECSSPLLFQFSAVSDCLVLWSDGILLCYSFFLEVVSSSPKITLSAIIDGFFFVFEMRSINEWKGSPLYHHSGVLRHLFGHTRARTTRTTDICRWVDSP